MESTRFFWIRAYLGSSKNESLKFLSVKKAYLDFCRTLVGISFNHYDRDTLFIKIENLISNVLEKKFASQTHFDEWHNNSCKSILYMFEEVTSSSIMQYGQAQKWLNMTIKYWFALGEYFIPGIESNIGFYHIPIDNYIQMEFEKLGIEKLNTAWSKINFDEYINYQFKIREKLGEKTPLLEEFRLFNLS